MERLVWHDSKCFARVVDDQRKRTPRCVICEFECATHICVDSLVLEATCGVQLQNLAHHIGHHVQRGPDSPVGFQITLPLFRSRSDSMYACRVSEEMGPGRAVKISTCFHADSCEHVAVCAAPDSAQGIFCTVLPDVWNGPKLRIVCLTRCLLRRKASVP
jgi:hypothetical protein